MAARLDPESSGKTRPPGVIDPQTQDGGAQLLPGEEERRAHATPATSCASDPADLKASGSAALPEADFLLTTQNPTSWRQEVAARVNRYRSRRRQRTPQNPSLQLRFEASEAAADANPVGPAARTQQPGPPREPSHFPSIPSIPSIPSGIARAPVVSRSKPEEEYGEPISAEAIEFAGSPNAPRQCLGELAEPVADHFRVLDAPELRPSPPALGGILIDPAAETRQEESANSVKPKPAPLRLRLAAFVVDASLVLVAVALFGFIFFGMTRIVLPWFETGALVATLAALYWYLYQWLLLVNTGSTPGLRLLKLEILRFGGGSVPRNLRQWRVLAGVLSGISVGLGYVWCWLDADGFCWHERITQTYIAPKP
jgi:uncharacterized RDD family membrane protein YckC